MIQTYSQRDIHYHLNKKRYRQRRFNTNFEIRTQLRLRNNLEKAFYRELLTTFRRNGRKVAEEVGMGLEFSQFSNARTLGLELIETLDKNLRRIFENIIKYNIMLYDPDAKDLEFTTFGTAMTFEILYREYFAGRTYIFETLTQNQSNAIYRLITRLRSQNLALPEIAKQITTTVNNFSRFRAARIARTETHSAASHASHFYNKRISEQIGQTLFKRWVAVGDERTRTSHANANGQVVGMDEDFQINGTLMKHPGDPRGGAKNVVNCRCVLVYVDEDDLGLIN
jgi:hypothetical protein